MITTELDKLREHCDNNMGWEKFYLTAELAAGFDSSRPFLEVGTRAGGSATILMKAISCSAFPQRWLHTIDPYGAKPYSWGHVYDEDLYREAMKRLSDLSYREGMNHCHWRMTSLDFFQQIQNQIGFWMKAEEQDWDFSLVFLDGEHDIDIVEHELIMILSRIQGPCTIIVDNWQEMWNQAREGKSTSRFYELDKNGEYDPSGNKLYYLSDKS